MQETVYIYLFDTLADWEIGYLSAELNQGELFYPGTKAPKVVTFGVTKDPIRTMGGLTVIPDITLDEIDVSNTLGLILPGGENWFEDTRHQQVLGLAAQFLDQHRVVGAICAASAAVIGYGLAEGKAHTSNNLDWLQSVFPSYQRDGYVEGPAVRDGNLITAAGTAPLEFTALVLQALGLSSEKTTTTWINLNKTSEARYFYELYDV